jgi:hypothetical protein
MRTLCQVLAHNGNDGPLSDPLISLNIELLKQPTPSIISLKLHFLANEYFINPQHYWVKLKNLLKDTMVLRRDIDFGKQKLLY